jgi:acyl-CoA thioesterase
MGWPAAVGPHPGSAFLAPSLDFAAWFHAASPHDDFVLIDAHSAIARDGCISATGRVFDRAGTLLASSGSQLLCTPVPKPA